MTKRMTGMILVAGVLLAFNCGCTSVRGVKPIQPKFGQAVSDLQPLLVWQADKDSNVTYDLTIKEQGGKGFTKKRDYYREGLKGNSHKVEAPLKPGTLYTWSIRPRKGEEEGEWNRQEKSIFLLLYYQHSTRPFEFKTP